VLFSSDTAATFISQIQTIGGSGASITVYNENSSSNLFLGQYSNANNGQFVSGANTVNVRVGGAWASIVPVTATSALWTPLAKITNATGYSARVNVKSGTYSSATAITLLSPANVGKVVLFRGYNTTAGDLDNVANPGTHPSLSFSSTASLTMPAYTRLENIDVTTSGSPNPLVTVSGLGVMMTRCRVTAGSGALTITGAGFDAWACYFATTSTTVTNTYCGSNGGLPRFLQCVFQGGLYNATLGYQGSFIECLMKNPTSHHVYSSAASQGSIFHRPTFYNSGASSDAINIATNIQYLTISYPIFANISRYAVNVPDSSFVGLRIVGADYYSVTSGQLNGVYENYQHAATTESSSPFTNASSNDFTLVSTSTAVTQTFVFEMP
jgi:hypothetical protein